MVGMAGDSSRRRGRRMICVFVCSYVNSTLRIVEESTQRSLESELCTATNETKSHQVTTISNFRNDYSSSSPILYLPSLLTSQYHGIVVG